MIDYIEISLDNYKVTPFFTHCKPFPCKLNMYGWESFILEGCKEMEVFWRPEDKTLKVKGSLPYFLQGHNFIFGRESFINCVEYLQSILGVGLWNAVVNEFEYGCIFPVTGKPSGYIRNHSASLHSALMLNERGRDKGAFRWWEDSKGMALKLYDAGKNIKMKQGLKAREVIESCGYDATKNYLKFEIHTKQPATLNDGKILRLETLQNPSFLLHLNDAVIQQYKRLHPMATLVPSTDKKKLSALGIVLSCYALDQMDKGIPLPEMRKNIYSFINQQEVFSTKDRDSRKATIKRAFDKLVLSDTSRWDLSEDIKRALIKEERP